MAKRFRQGSVFGGAFLTGETTFLHRLMLAVTKTGARIFRNHVGTGWQGKVFWFNKYQSIAVQPGDVLIRHARALEAGLCEGSSDLVGWKTVEILPAMVGKRLAVFVAIEAKTAKGRLTDEQRTFLKAVREAGGIAIEGRDIDDVVATFVNRLLI